MCNKEYSKKIQAECQFERLAESSITLDYKSLPKGSSGSPRASDFKIKQ